MPIKTLKRKIWTFLEWVLQLHDTPESIAMGCAIGMALAFTPTFGLQMIICVLLSLVIRMNRLMALALVQVTNYLTAIPLYYFSYRVGAFVTRSEVLGYSNFRERFIVENGTFWNNWIAPLVKILVESMVPLWVGGVLVGCILAVPTYFLTRWFVRHHRVALASKGKLKRIL